MKFNEIVARNAAEVEFDSKVEERGLIDPLRVTF